jgi:hypothetical protein
MWKPPLQLRSRLRNNDEPWSIPCFGLLLFAWKPLQSRPCARQNQCRILWAGAL